MFTIELETGNSAFDDNPRTEIARILRELADKIESVRDVDYHLYDAKGNRVGKAEFVP